MRTPIAIIGMGAILPDAASIGEYWDNILFGKDCIREIPELYWDIKDFYDPDPHAKDKSYGYKAGAIGEIAFDSIGYGISPAAMESISVEQLYALAVARQALLDADMIGANAKPFNREKTGVILAAGIGKNAFSLSRRQDMPRARTVLQNSGAPDDLVERVIKRLTDIELEWTENSEPGYLANVTAGRIANRFNLNGTNCAVDAACASGMAALKIAVSELQSGDCDVVLAGGVNLDLTASAFISFCKTPAISKHNISRPFDADADGMLLGDGVAMVVLKRLADAERDRDRIYAVVKSVGSSGDGRATSIFAPSVEGQMKALERAYEKTDFDPASVALIEAHGTGTYLGDGCELTALNQFFGGRGLERGSIAIGSVKSQIGHTRLAAGMAGLIKTALSIYHKTLPPTINVNKDRPDIMDSPFYTVASPKPWVASGRRPLRRAGLSSFGFGGTNFHAVLEEYAGAAAPAWRRTHRVPAAICLHAPDTHTLIAECESLAENLRAGLPAYDALLDGQHAAAAPPIDAPRVSFAAEGPDDAAAKLLSAAAALKKVGRTNEIRDEKYRIYFREKGLPPDAKIMTMFSGQGSQYVGMFKETARDYPEMIEFMGLAGLELESLGLPPIAEILYPGGAKNMPPDAEDILRDTKYTQPALAAVCGGAYEILKSRGYSEDCLIGHSFGELTGLWAGGAIDAKTFARLAAARGHAISSGGSGVGMIAISASRETCERLIGGHGNLYIANENSAMQTVVSGEMKQIMALESDLVRAKTPFKVLNVSQAFHSPYMAEPNKIFNETLGGVKIAALKKTLYSGSGGVPYNKRAANVKKTLSRQLELPLKFVQCIEHAYDNGVRVFVEVGPGNVLAKLVNSILKGREFVTVAINGNGGAKGANIQLEDAVAYLRALGQKIGGDPHRMQASDIYKDDKPKSAYMINPMVYMTPAKTAIVERAINEVFDAANHQPREVQGTDYLKGDSDMERGALESIVGLQNLNSQALEKFLASQGHQIGVFKELLQEADGGSNKNEMLRLIEIFQNNSMKAFETYINSQNGMLTGLESPAGAGLAAVLSMAAAPVPAVSATIPGSAVSAAAPVPAVSVTIPGSAVSTAAPIMVASSAQAELPPAAPPSFSIAHGSAAPGDGDSDSDDGADDFDPVQIIISIISEKTGYPEDMVEADMNIETDLGIDSIKRIEIFSELNNRLSGGLNEEDVESISMLHSIKEIGDYLKKKELTQPEQQIPA